MADPAAVADPDQGWVDVPNPAPAQGASSPSEADSGWQDVPNPAPKGAPPPPEKTPLGFGKNVLASGLHLAQNVGSAVMHPRQTSDALFDTLYGYGRQVARNVGREVPDDEEGRRADRARDAFWNYVKSRYGSGEGFKNAWYSDPAGMAADLSAVFGGGAEAAKIGQLGETAKVLGTASEWANPLGIPSKIVSGTLGHFMPKPPAALGPGFDPATGTFANEFDPKTGQFVEGQPMKFTTEKPPAPPAPGAGPAFDPATASFGNEFDPATGTFGESAPLKFTTQEPAPRTGPLSQDDVARLRQQWGIKPPRSGIAGPEAAPPPKPQAPPPEPAPPAPAPKPKPQAPPPPPPAPTPAAAAAPTVAGRVRNTLIDIGVGAGVEYLTHSLLGGFGGFAGSAAVRYLPEFLRTPTGQQMLSRIGPGSTAAQIAAAARDLTPALNAFARNCQISLASPSALDTKAKGGAVNPELARVQCDRLGPGVILGSLAKH